MEHSVCVFKLSVGMLLGHLGGNHRVRHFVLWKTRPHSATFCILPTVIPTSHYFTASPMFLWCLRCYSNSLRLLYWRLFTCSWPPVYLLRCQLLGWHCNQDIYFLTINFSQVFVFRNNPLLVECSAHTSSQSVSCLLIPLMSHFCNPTVPCLGHQTFYVTCVFASELIKSLCLQPPELWQCWIHNQRLFPVTLLLLDLNSTPTSVLKSLGVLSF